MPDFRSSVLLCGSVLALAVASASIFSSGAHAQQGAADSLREAYRDWVVQCQTPTDGARACELFQQVDHEESGRRVTAFSMRILGDGRVAVVTITPFGLRLVDGMRIQVGDEVVAQFPFDTCTTDGCIVTGIASDALLDAMQDGARGGLVFAARNGTPFAVPLSLSGFSSALARLRELVAP
ncbi:MAG: invasion associated locus B family protein [Alphaproteobacteria bacterium]|nr:invasion associated locus B family protein [Alphaproteobacteria bacterium]